MDLLAWYATVQLAGLAVWPLVARALAPLADRGWTAAKALGMLGVSWLVWLLCMLSPLPFTRLTLALGLAGVAAVSWLGLRGRWDQPDIGAWSRTRWRSLAAWEGLFVVVFAFFALLRAHQPEIQGTEKPMDMAFLNGFVTAERLPTEDTWLSGYGVPYYHFGYLVLACVTKLSGVSAGVGYNLAAATIPALAAVALGGLAWNLSQAAKLSVRWASVAVGLVGLLTMATGNLSAVFELLLTRGWLTPEAGPALGIKRFGEGLTPGVWPPDGTWWFQASRVVPNTQPDGINEFPFFSAYLSDLHPHFMAFPFEALALTCVAAHAISRGATLRSPWTQGAAMLALGGLLVINTWDIAPFWLLYCGLTIFTADCCTWRRRIALALAGPVGGAVLFAPYFVGYGGPPLGVGIVSDRTPLSSLLVLFGPQLLLLVLLGMLVRARVADRRGWVLAAAGVAVGLGLGVMGEGGLGVLTALVVLLLPWPDVRAALAPAEVMTLGVAWFASAMLLGVELIFLDDVFHTRMNTVFKFHENVWLLAGLAAGVGVALSSRRARSVQALMGACAALAVALGLAYPLSAAATRLAEQPAGGPSLDGTAFLSQDEAGAIRWLRAQNGPARVVVAEAVGGEYSGGARMATFSGGTTVVGWVGHELQWRGPLPELSRRQTDVEQAYRATDLATLRAILERYGVQFMVVGDFERQQYGDGMEANVQAALPVAFRSGRTTVYRVR